ncbi:hypothetical protein QJS83_11860 [Bdellovibrio sp. 22V]|uniref:hypothetical protein n=1 Tax=Bdellovibrio TaxID=958 RepID=UPI0025431045|nr:hypothetical protein [Bdellovibrio sp. 22V]WII71155.1 hypothetical protein QJS83_11860 [Bdellovibrio sp. 22V]
MSAKENIAKAALGVTLGALVMGLFYVTSAKKNSLDQIAVQLEKEFFADPVVKAKLSRMPASEVAAFVSRSAHNGLYWLSPQELDTWNQIRIAMAKSSPELCVSYIRGGTSQKDITQAFAQIGEKSARTWIALSLTAAKQSIQRAEPLDNQNIQKEFQEGLLQVVSVNGPEEQFKLAEILHNYLIKDDEETCWAAIKIHENAMKLDSKARHSFLRVLAVL